MVYGVVAGKGNPLSMPTMRILPQTIYILAAKMILQMKLRNLLQAEGLQNAENWPNPVK